MYTYGYLFYIPITVLFLLYIIIMGFKKRRPLGFFLASCIICAYLNLMIEKAFFPIWLDGSRFFTNASDYIELRLSFWEWNTFQLIGNLLLTMPIGFCLPFLFNITKRKNCIFTVIGSLSIEFVQLIMIILLHTVDITFDLNDIILNLLGGILGYFCFSTICFGISKLFKRFLENSMQNGDLFSFIHMVCDSYTRGKKSMSYYDKI